MERIRLLLLSAALLIGGCGNDANREAPPESLQASLPGVYSGTFPCENCPGIQTTLWLRADSRFFIRQEYPGTDGGDVSRAYNLGRWTWSDYDRSLVLKGDGPDRVFAWREPASLVMHTGSDLEHLLSREPQATEFVSSIRMSGMMHVAGDGVTFTECLSGLRARVDEGGDFARFAHQYRGLRSRGEPAFVELEGRFAWSADGSPAALTIDHFVTVRPGRTC